VCVCVCVCVSVCVPVLFSSCLYSISRTFAIPSLFVFASGILSYRESRAVMRRLRAMAYAYNRRACKRALAVMVLSEDPLVRDFPLDAGPNIPIIGEQAREQDVEAGREQGKESARASSRRGVRTGRGERSALEAVDVRGLLMVVRQRQAEGSAEGLDSR
jgi:hypothetical protein